MESEKRIDSFVNLVVNSTVIIGALMTEAIGGAMGEVAAGMTEGLAGALDNTGDAKRQGEEVRKEAARNVPAAVREMVGSMLAETRGEFGAAIGRITPDQRKELLADLGDESYDRAFDAIRKEDFGLPRLTEPLSVDDVLGYVRIAGQEDSRFADIMQAVNSVKEPRLFAEMKKASGCVDGEGGKAAPEKAAEPLPKTIGKLPATYLFPPGAEAAISLKGKKDLNLSWEMKLGPGESCDDFGIKVSQDGSSTKTPYGGMTLRSVKGKIQATIRNLEAFPVTVEIKAEE